jgi:hypothetical protein
VRVVNVVDLMTLFPREFHPHGMSETRFVELFTANKQIVFAFHGYRRAIHEIVHGHIDVDRFHVRGFSEQGTTTTPLDMVLLNGMSRYHLAMDALKRIDPGCRAGPRPDLDLRAGGLDLQRQGLLQGAPRGPARDPRLGVDSVSLPNLTAHAKRSER